MPYAKHTSTPPPLDAARAVKDMSAPWRNFPEWKRWVEATGSQDGRGLKDVVEANAIGLDQLKGNVDAHTDALATINGRLNSLTARITALEESPPFPG